ncbi:hypothetical protein J7T55_007658 [Diaporthe amygdali]|uniref:uncharacterized protein n=1 Tax=Phomopsis amygdali TaxID=1214568 RepID=UPI0022FE9498|nr:uncharacterized protein J7T55_007658 [Diaporthe amygdali]KAJ0107469.1 hypothetical protein J7T55_007658 [Diaporthe amygdali]
MKCQSVLFHMPLFLLAAAAAQVPFHEYVLAPNSRVISPVSIYQAGGNVENAAGLLNTRGSTLQDSHSTSFSGNGSYVTLDFGKNVAGRVAFQVDAVSGSTDSIGFTFSESSMYISAQFCDAVIDGAFDLPQWFNDTTPGHYEAGHEFQRGAFRYLTIVHNSTETISLSNVTVYWSTSPEMTDPSDYTVYFHSDNEKLNRVCVLLDGGKRDRIVWPGDIVISGPSIFVSTTSLEPIRNALDSLFLYQESDGRLPAAGYPLAQLFAWSFTYHCHTLNDVYDYFMFTGDVDYITSLWDRYRLGVDYLLQFIDSSGLANVTSTSDWVRSGRFHIVLHIEECSQACQWESFAAGIPTAANDILWDKSVSLYRDNDTIEDSSSAPSYPQDGNSWAVIAGIANGTRAEAVSDALKARWVLPYGAPAVEAGQTISPFTTGFEIQAHYMAGHSEYATDLMEFMWADYMLDGPRMTNSTFIEGYATDGTPLYPVYNYDPRVSHAHGWSTAPTSMLTLYGGGLTMTSAAGLTWKVAPALGSLKTIRTGFETPLGSFTTSWTNIYLQAGDTWVL